MILNNNDYMKFAQPRAFLTKSGLAGVGQSVAASEMSSMFSDWNMDSVSKAMTALNSQTVFLLNLQRQNEGLQPLNVQTASPAVNVGITPEAQKVVIGLGLVAALAFFLSRR